MISWETSRLLYKKTMQTALLPERSRMPYCLLVVGRHDGETVWHGSAEASDRWQMPVGGNGISSSSYCVFS